MNILALDTAADGCSVALHTAGTLIERDEATPRKHAASLLPMAQACLAEAGLNLADLDAIAFGRGPGSFTGLRIAAGVAQGIAFGAGLPVVPVSNLAANAIVARRAHGWDRILVAFDARMGEVYAGAFEIDADGLPCLVGAEALLAPGDLAAPGSDWRGAGSAFAAWPELATSSGVVSADSALAPRARDLLDIAADAFTRGLALPAEEALPVYLREQVAWQGGGPSR